MVPAQELIRTKHCNSILAAAFGVEFACSRASDHARRTWKVVQTAAGPAGTFADFDHFVFFSYSDLHETDIIPRDLPTRAIAFFAWTTFAFGAYTFQSRSAAWWHVLDIDAPNPALIVPMPIFKPYGQSTMRQENVMRETDPRALWFIRSDGGLGVPVVGELPVLWHGHKDFLRLDGSPRKTIKIKVNWPGYERWEKQIRPMSDKGDNSVKRLANLVANKVNLFLSEHDINQGHTGTNPRYVVGTQPGQISARDVLLLGIVIVSGGAAMPIVQLRDGFAFAF
ncbi:hypothetical protein PENSPDRAFT_684626 [Peniophora sp. CONT]|nr:hypothetical protein PENSPDRAFT_684626 [Peniophora sp. CONT]